MLLAVQGAQAAPAIELILPGGASLRPFHVRNWPGGDGYIAATRFGSRPGFELFLDNETGLSVYRRLIAGGVTPAGLGMRETCRVDWCNRLNTWAPLRGVLRGPTVIDVDDLGDRLSAQLHGLTGDASFATDALRWRRLQRTAAAEADRLVVCSELDRQRMGSVATCGVVPNVYLAPTDVAPLPTAETGPHILLQGIFVWPPNLDAAQRLVREVLSLVVKEFPDARVWLVGMHDGPLGDLAGDNVDVIGLVEDVRPYVRAADVVAIPLRRGSGTRLKLLESFALGTPVVSTTLGAEGINALHSKHLLIADSSEDFAEAVLTVLRDPAAARRMPESARTMTARDYDRTVLLDSVRETVELAQKAFGYFSGRRAPCPGGGLSVEM